MERAVNPKTGEVVFFNGNQWVKPTGTATNNDGDTAYLVNNQWQVIKAAAPIKNEQPSIDAPMGDNLGASIMAASESPKPAQTIQPAQNKLEVSPSNSINAQDYLASVAARKEENPERTLSGTAIDAGVTFLKSAIGLPEAFVGLADIPTAGYVGKVLEKAGYKPKEAKEILDTYLSEAQQAANRKVGEAKGFGSTVSALLQNPSVIATSAAESLPQMLGGAGIARSLLKAAPKIGAVAAGAAGEGILGAGSAAEQMRQESKSGLLSGKQALSAVGSGVGTAAFGLAGGKLANKLGLDDIDTMLASGATRGPAKSVGDFVKRAGASGVSEGVFEEMPQSAQEKMWMNYATDKPVMEGVPEAMGAGLVTGAAMGMAGAGAGSLARNKSQTPPPPPGSPSNSPVVSIMTVNSGGKQSIKTTREDGSVDIDGKQVTPPTNKQESFSDQTKQRDKELQDLLTPANPPAPPATSPAPTKVSSEPSTPVTKNAPPPAVVPASNEQPNKLTEQRTQDQSNVLELEKELGNAAPEKATPVPAPAVPAFEPIVVKPKEDYANKSLEELQSLRETADQTNHAMDMAAIEKHFGPEMASAYEKMDRRQRNKWWDQNATDLFERDSSVFNGVDENLIDEYIKAHNNFDTESPRALGRSIGLLALNINDPGFIGSPDFVRLKNALAYAKQQGFSEAEVLNGMRERAVQWAGADAQELFKDLFKSKPTETKVGISAPAKEDIPLADEEFAPFGEDLTGQPIPERPEVQTLLEQQAQANKDIEALSKRTAGTSLYKVLTGSLKDSEMSELGGRSRDGKKNPFMFLVAKKGKPGSSMEDMVESGALDLFLPPKMRVGNPMYDNGESAAYIREKLIQGQYYTYDTQVAISIVTEGIRDLDKLIQEELSIDDINKEIERAFDEQREADLNAEKAAPSGETGSSTAGKGTEATNDELDKREAQLEREAQLNEREARLLEERKRLEEERLKLESPTKADVVDQEERKAKAAELDEKEQIKKESEAGAGQFELTREEGRQDTTSNLFDQPAPEPEVVAISPEQERKEAVINFALRLGFHIPPFRVRFADGVQLLKPKDLTSAQIQEIVGLASDALDLGLPASVLGNVTAAGSTRVDARAIMTQHGFLMIAKQWKDSTNEQKLQTLIHEFGHAVDNEGNDVSDTANWSKAHSELQSWYDNSKAKNKHPLAYPFSPDYKGRVRPKRESFAQAFSYYFTSPVDLQNNAPEAYSQIQAIVERIQDGSQKARAAGTTATGTAGIKIQPTRVEKDTTVRPNSSEVSTAVGATTGGKDRDVVEVNASLGQTIFGKAPLVNWTTPDQTSMDQVIKYLADKHIDTKRVIEAIQSTAGKIADAWNPYLKEENFHGRTAKQTKDFTNHELTPLMNEMRDLGVSMGELEEYLQNRHAQERNEQIAAINPNQQDKGSGIKTADAQSYLANLSQDQLSKYKTLAKMVDSITSGTRQLLVDSGLESQDTIDKWESTYKYYVPLNRDDVDYTSNHGMSVGQGFSVKGPASRRATGSERKVVDILANIAMQRERNIVRAEKNRVAIALYGLALKNPNPKFWLAVNPDAKQNIGAAVNELVDMGFMPSDVRKLMEEPRKTEIDPQTGLVREVIHQIGRGADNVMAMRVNGENRYVFFNQNNDRANSMVRSMKNLDADQLGPVLSNMALATRYIASVNTQYNPVFGAVNFMRDVQGAMLQLSTTEIAGEQKAVGKNIMPAMLGIYQDLRLERQGKIGRSQWSRLWEDFQQHGGQTGFRDQFSRSEDRGRALQKIIDPASWADSKLGKIFSANGKLIVPIEAARKSAAPLFNWLSDYNETMENAVRLSAYKVALDKGFSKDKAASIAKNLTVNFNRKGDVATQAGALYAFFNASVQGTARLAQTLAGPAGKAIIGGGLFLGVLEAVMMSMAGFGDDEPPDFVKEKNFIIPIMSTGKYIAIPVALGYNVIPNFSRLLTEATIRGIEGKPVKATETLFKIFDSLFGAFNPIGNAGWSFQTFAPTIADPLVALGENKDWTGKKIAREDFNSLHPTPGYLRAKESASTFGRVTAKFLNSLSGGTADVKGKLSPTPDQIDYLVGQVTGGVGRELMKFERAGRTVVTGEELPAHALPIVGRFYGDTKESSSVANRFYGNLVKMNEYEDTIKGMRSRKENVQTLFKENPEARAHKYADEVERDVQKLRKRRHALVEKGAPKEEVKAIEMRITAHMKRLNDKIESYEKKRSTNED